MASAGHAFYDKTRNRLGVVRSEQHTTRVIRCVNLYPKSLRVFGIQIDGDEIWVCVGSHQSDRPNRKIGYRFSSLSGGGGRALA